MSADSVIIIKKKKGGHGHAHHGGAWKVAYADFVTAMMAFFLLMWLLNATTESQRKGIADYFDPTIPISRVSGGGSDMFAGSSIFAKERLARDGTGGTASKLAAREKAQSKRDEDMPPDAQREVAHKIDPQRQPGTLRDSEDQGNGYRFDMQGEAPSARHPDRNAAAGEREGEAEARAMAEAEHLTQSITERVRQADHQGLDRHLIFRATEEGLRIEVVDRDGAPMFESGVADATPRMQALVRVIAEVVRETGNRVALTGHTDAIPFTGGRYGNWELSTDRAHSARHLLERHGVGRARIQRVEGLADTVPLIADDPADPRNRRIGIVILRGDRQPPR